MGDPAQANPRRVGLGLARAGGSGSSLNCTRPVAAGHRYIARGAPLDGIPGTRLCIASVRSDAIMLIEPRTA